MLHNTSMQLDQNMKKYIHSPIYNPCSCNVRSFVASAFYLILFHFISFYFCRTTGALGSSLVSIGPWLPGGPLNTEACTDAAWGSRRRRRRPHTLQEALLCPPHPSASPRLRGRGEERRRRGKGRNMWRGECGEGR